MVAHRKVSFSPMHVHMYAKLTLSVPIVTNNNFLLTIIHTLSRDKVMRINKMIFIEKIP